MQVWAGSEDSQEFWLVDEARIERELLDHVTMQIPKGVVFRRKFDDCELEIGKVARARQEVINGT
jgi:hypothetical protein